MNTGLSLAELVKTYPLHNDIKENIMWQDEGKMVQNTYSKDRIHHL